jgi:MSHA biogenesis protein MshQ
LFIKYTIHSNRTGSQSPGPAFIDNMTLATGHSMALKQILIRCLFLTLMFGTGFSFAAPGDILFQEQFNNNGDLNSDWTASGGGSSGVDNSTFNSAPRSAFMSGNGRILTSRPNRIDTNVPAADLTLWIRRGADSFSENPDPGEDLRLDYLNSSNNWIPLATYPGGGTPGEIITPTFNLPADALYNDLRLRFVILGGSNGFDFWHIDDVTVTEAAPPETIPPVAQDDSASTFTSFSVNIDLAANDTDAQSGIDLTSIAIVSPAANGSIIVNADGTVDYTHDGSATTSDSFTYTIRDNAGNVSNVATVTITVQSVVCETFADDFNAGTTNNNTGTQNFSTPWNFRSVTNGGLGYAQMANNRLQIQGNNLSDASLSGPYDYDNNWAERNATLGGYNVATLTFDFIAVGGLEVEDEALVEISSDGGATFTTLQVFNGYTTTTTVPVSLDISAFISPTFDTRIRIRIAEDDNSTPCCFGANGEYIEIDNFEIQACRTSAIDHYIVTAVTPTVTCEQSNVTVTAVDAANLPIDIPAGTTLTMSTDIANDGWTNPATVNSNQYTLPADAASVVFQLRKLTPATLEIDVDGSDGATDDDGNRNDDFVVFNDAGFKFYGNGAVDGLGNQIAGKPSNVNPDSQVTTIRAIQTNPATGRCDALITNASASINFAYQCDNPNTCALANNGMAINGSPSIDDINTGYTPITVSFDATGTGTFNFNYFDAGQIRIFANADLDVGGAGTANVQGNSNAFIVKPFAFDIRVAGDPNAIDENSPRFTNAGTNFDTTIRSVLWEAADDLDSDGVADVGADLEFNGVTPNIVNIAGNISLTPSAHAGASSNGALAVNVIDFSSFSAANSPTTGTIQVTQSWSETGILAIDALTPNFMGTGNSIATRRSGIGRFSPAYFDFNNLVAANACGTFTYGGFLDGVNPGLDKPGQDFSITGQIIARNSSGGITTNYRGVWVKFNQTNISASGYDNATMLLTNTLNFSANSVTDNGDGTLDFAEPDAHYQFANLRGPLDLFARLTVTDTDTITTAANWDTNPVQQRLGRLRIIDAYGPEIGDLEMRLRSEYFDGAAWLLNAADSCSNYVQTDAAFDATSYTDNLSAGETTIFSPAATQTLVNGVSALSNGIWFTAPGADNYGSVKIDLDLSTKRWLQFDWDGDNTVDNTSGILNFGYYRGSDRVIYWREI